jgi:hypothetical protein
MFSGATPPPRGQPPRPPAAPVKEEGNFTQLFSPKYSEPQADDLSRRLNRGVEPTPGSGGATGTSFPAQRPTAPPQAQKPPEPGDFTRMFSAPTKPVGPGSSSGGGDYTDSLYGKPAEGGTGLPPSSGSASAPPPSPGGSEYTRALKRVSFGDMKPAAGAAPAAAPAGKEKEEVDLEKKPSYLPVILIVVGLIVVLVIVLVVFSSLSGL